MRKPAFCICENKDADQLRSNCAADQRLFSPYGKYNPSSTEVRNFKPLAIFCDCTARFVLDLVRNPEDRFSHNEAHLITADNATVIPRRFNVKVRFSGCLKVEMGIYLCK